MNAKLPHLGKREVRPRNTGLTMVMDKGVGLTLAKSFLESTEDFIDIIKLGFGTSLIDKNLKEKIKYYQSRDMRVYPGGTLFEAFYARGKYDEFKKYLDKWGFDMVEVSDGSIVLPHDKKCEIIADLAKDRTVLSEVGSKQEGYIISPAKWIKMMVNELQAGSWKVIAEARESGTVGIYRPNGQAHVLLINKIINKVKLENILWEAPKKDQQVWFIQNMGENVNLGNILFEEVIPLECLRLGLRGDTFFTFLPENTVSDLKP